MNKLYTKKAVTYILQQCPELITLFDTVGQFNFDPEHRDVHESLIRSITSQMISTVAAKTILSRLVEKANILSNTISTDFPDLRTLSLLDSQILRTLGYSQNKAFAICQVIEKSISGELPNSTTIQSMSDTEIISTMTSLRGIGQWSAEMLLIWSLARPDIWPVDDLGIRRGFRLWRGDLDMPTPKQLRLWGEQFRPYRTLLALYFWKLSDQSKGK
jgi:DNA-3-methyladenine glycosylase II